eukprot:4446345-Pyramimonas_sp.AAC.1
MRRAWWSMGRFWFARSVSSQLKKLVFQCRVQGSALSGLESFVLTTSDYRLLGSNILGWGKQLLGGAGVLKIPQPDGALKHRALPPRKLWRLLGLVPARLELRIRRL